MTKKNVKNTARKAVTTVGKMGGIALAVALVLAHVAASAVGALVCAIAKE